MELLIIRHGQSQADLLGVHEGRADFPLTELGEEQASKLSKYIKENFPPDFIISSPLKRAGRTAEILQEGLECDLVYDEMLMEFNNGVLAGLKREEAAVLYPLPKNGRPPHIPILQGESELEFRFRAEQFLQKILHDFQEAKRIAIVSHGGLISNLIQSVLGLPTVNPYSFSTGDTGFHLIQIHPKQNVIKFLNSTSHL